MTRNLCIDYSRRKKVQYFDENEYQNSISDTIIDDEANPEKQLIKDDLKENIERAINLLPEKIRSIIIMREIQDLKYELIAETTGLPLNSVKVYIHRGRRLLFKNLKQYSKNDFQ